MKNEIKKQMKLDAINFLEDAKTLTLKGGFAASLKKARMVKKLMFLFNRCVKEDDMI